MRTILSEVNGLLANELSLLATGVRYTVYSNKYIVIEGHKGLIDFKDNYVILKGTSSPMKINGRNLIIKHLNKEMAIIEGEIISVEGIYVS